MIRHALKQMTAVVLLQKNLGTTPRKGKRNPLGSILMASFLVLALAGCCVLTPPVGKLDFYPDTISVKQGQTIVLEAHDNAFDQPDGWHYQWQTVLGDDGTDIPGANGKELVLKHAGPKDGLLYRCKLYRNDFDEIKYTSEIGLLVAVPALASSGGGTPIDVTGPFQPGTANPSPKDTCCSDCAGFMQMLSSANSIWWQSDPANAHTGTFGFLPAPGQAGQVMVLNFPPLQKGAPWCGTTGTNGINSVTFPVVSGARYMLVVCFPTKAPPKGTPITYSIVWQ
jgi:hypothetical protein